MQKYNFGHNFKLQSAVVTLNIRLYYVYLIEKKLTKVLYLIELLMNIRIELFDEHKVKVIKIYFFLFRLQTMYL